MVAELAGDQGTDDRADISDGEQIADVTHAERKCLGDQRGCEGRHDRVVTIDHRDDEADDSDCAWADVAGRAFADALDLIYICHDNPSRHCVPNRHVVADARALRTIQ